MDRVVAAYIEQIEPRVFQAAVTGKRAIGKVANAMENAKVAITGIIEGTPFRFTKEEGEEGPTPED